MLPCQSSALTNTYCPCFREKLYSEHVESIKNFETKTAKLDYVKCPSCKCVKLGMKLTKSKTGLLRCKTCHDKNYTTSMFAHPTWTDTSGIVHYTIPEELKGLREGERLLIQLVSPFVPLQHLQKGNYGCKGHLCSFPQSIQSLCNVLPRLPSDVHVGNIAKNFRDSDNNPCKTTFKVRKDKVLTALRWLKHFNPQYKDITIAEENLDWIDGCSGELPPTTPEDDLFP